MKLYQRTVSDKSVSKLSGDVTIPPSNEQHTVLCLTGMSATSDPKITTNAMGGAMRSFANSIANISAMQLDSDFFGDEKRKVAGVIKCVEGLLGGCSVHQAKLNGSPIVFLAASSNSVEQNLADMAFSNKYNDYFTAEATEIVSRVVLPRIAENIEVKDTVLGVNITGDKLPIETAKENLRRLTIFAQSGGTAVARMMENSLNYAMTQLGYNNSEKQALAAEITIFGVGNVSKLNDIRGTRFNGIYVESDNDLVIQHLNEDKINNPNGKGKFCIVQLPTCAVAFTTTPEKLNLPSGLLEEPPAHHMFLYTQRDNIDGSNSLNAQLSENILRNMVVREGGFDVTDFFKAAKPLTSNALHISSSFSQRIIDSAVSDVQR